MEHTSVAIKLQKVLIMIMSQTTKTKKKIIDQ